MTGTMKNSGKHKYEENHKEHMNTKSKIPFTNELLWPRGRAIFLTKEENKTNPF